MIKRFCFLGIRHKTTISREVPIIKEQGLATEKDTESDDSKSSTSTELCDEPDQLSDFDSEEPASISETSVQVLLTGEADVTVLPFPSPADKSDLSASKLPRANDPSPLKPLKYAVTPSESRGCFILESKSSVAPSEKFAGKSVESVGTESSPEQQPLLVLEEFKIRSSEDTEILPPEEIANLANISSTVAADNVGLTSQAESFSLKIHEFDSKLSSSDETFVCKPTTEVYIHATDNTCKLPVSMDTSKVMCSKDSTSGSEDDHAKHTASEELESAIKMDASDILKQTSSTEGKSPVSSEWFIPLHTTKSKMTTNEETNSHDTILKENKDRNYDFWTKKDFESLSEVYGTVASDTHLAQQHITYLSSPDVLCPENKTEEEMSKISADLKSVKFTGNCLQKSTPVLEITLENHWDSVETLKYPITETLQYLHDTQCALPTSLSSRNLSPTTPMRMLQDDTTTTTTEKEDVRDNDVGSKDELKVNVRTDQLRTEISVPELHRFCVPLSDTADNDQDVQTDALQCLKCEEDRCVNMGDNRDVSELCELNLTLHVNKLAMKEGSQACEVGDIANMEITETDSAEMSEVLEIGQNIHLGRRNSENALKIIQENSEILQRILHCQVRRPSKLSEEESSDSNLPSIPTSSSPEKADITPCQQLQAVSDKMKRVSSDSCIQAVASPKDDVSGKLTSEILLTSIIPGHLLPKCHKATKIFPDHTQSEEGVSIETKRHHLEKEEHIQETTAEHFDSCCYLIPAVPVDFMKEREFFKPRQEEKHAACLSSGKSLSLSQEISSDKTPRFSADSHILQPESKISDTVTQVLHSSNEQSLSQSEDAATFNLTGSFVPSSLPLCANVHHVESREHGTTELELERKQTSAIDSGWKGFQALDSSLDKNISSKLPKCYSAQATAFTSYRLYSSKVVEENLQFLDSSEIPVTETKVTASAKLTDKDDGDIRRHKHLITTERTSSDLQSHIDTSSSEPSSDSSISSWFAEKCKLKDDFSAAKSTFEKQKLSRPSSSYSVYSSDLSTSEYGSSARTKSTCTEDKLDYFQRNSSTHTESLPSWYIKYSTMHPSDNFAIKSSSNGTEILPRGDYRQKSSCCSTEGFTEDFQYSFRPNATSTVDFNSGTQDVTSIERTGDQSRTHSTSVSGVTSSAVLNRSYSSSSIDGCITKMRPDLSLPANYSDQEHHPYFKSESDILSSQALDKHTSTMYSPTYEKENSMEVPATVECGPSSKPPRRSESEPKHSPEDLLPPHYSLFPHSRCDKDNPILPIKSEYRKDDFDPNDFSTESLLVTPSLSTTKTGTSYSNSLSPTKSKNIYVSLPPLKTSNGSPTRSKSTFDPFPPRSSMRQPKELGIKLGLYSSDCGNKNVKSTNKKT